MHRKLKEKSASALFTAAFFFFTKCVTFIYLLGDREACACWSPCVESKGQLLQVSSLFPLCGAPELMRVNVPSFRHVGLQNLCRSVSSFHYVGLQNLYAGQFPQELRGVEEALSD